MTVTTSPASPARPGRRRAVATLASVAVVLAVLGVTLSVADAGSSVTPRNGPRGHDVVGTYKGSQKRLATMLFEVGLNGETSFMFCIDLGTLIEFGVAYDESTWSASQVPNLDKVTRVLARTDATSTRDPVEIAAAQAAIWHFSDGFDLDLSNPRNDAAVVARYQALVSDAEANPVTAEPAGTLDVSPPSASVAQGRPAFFDVTTTATAPIAIELSDAAATAHPAQGSTCDVATAIVTVTGPSRICLTTTSTHGTVSMTLRTAVAPLNAGRVFIRPGRQKLIVGRSGQAKAHAVAAASWTPNGRPTVRVVCPTAGVRHGEPTTFTAEATDPENDPMTYAWSLNGAPIAGATASSATVALQPGDRLSVSVSDGVGAAVSADANCRGDNPPTVTVSCPAELRLGESNRFQAAGVDPDGDPLVYRWTLNGAVIDGATGPDVDVVVSAGDVLAVSATDPGGATSAATTAACIPPSANRPPTVTLDCPAGLTFGRASTFTAAGADPDGDPLTYRWTIDGDPVADQTGPTASLTIRAGQEVGVTVSDGTTSSSAATVVCSGGAPNLPPTVTLTCPDDLVWGRPATFEARGDDPDGDPLRYEWRVDGRVVAGATGSTAELTVERGQVVDVTAVDDAGAASARVVGNCAGNTPPTVTLACPAAVFHGEPVVFTAVGADDDGDPLTYRWSVNGVEVPGQTASSASLVVQEDDRVNVAAIDAHGEASASRTVQCPGSSRPRVTITCPFDLVWGEPAAFIANGVDPDGDTDLVYSWSLNGVPVEGALGPKLTVAVAPTDVLTVTVTDSDGVSSAAAGADCAGDSRPTVALECPDGLTFGVPATFTATGSDPDGDELTYRWTVNDQLVEGVEGATATLTLAKGDRVAVTATATGLTSAAATSTCDGASAPTVATTCPTIVALGEPVTFRATGADADGDTLTYRWTVNGVPVEGVTGPAASLRLDAGDTVAVTAEDPTGLASATATFDCATGTRPILSLACPDGQLFGQPAAFRAEVERGDAAALVFTWAVNGKVLAGVTGDTAVVSVQPDDLVAVTAVGLDGLVAATVGATCGGTTPPTIPDVPSMPQVLSSTVYTVAQRAALESLATTGTTTAGLVAVAALALAGGAGLVGVSRRRVRSSAAGT